MFEDSPEKIHKDMHDNAWLADQHLGSDDFHKYAKAHHDARAKYEEVTGKSPVIYANETDTPICAHCGDMF